MIKHAKGVKFVVQMCQQLKLPAQTIFAAATFLHRFYVRYSLRHVHQYDTAAACVLLASKTEETPRPLKDVALAAARTAAHSQLPENHPDVAKWAETVAYTEEMLLEGLFFDLSIPSPYDALARLLRTYSMSRVPDFGQMATTFINDSCRTMLVLVYQPPQIAASAVYWASKYLRVPVPDVDGERWYVREGIDRRMLVDVVNTMSDMLQVVRQGNVDGQVYDRLG